MRLVTGGILLAYVVVFLAVNGTKRTSEAQKGVCWSKTFDAITLSLDVILSMILVGTVMFLFDPRTSKRGNFCGARDSRPSLCQ